MMRRLLAALPAASARFSYGLVNGTIHRHERATVLVLGCYAPEEPYPGTDRLSMAVMPDAIRLADLLAEDDPPHGASRLLFEGDRLFSLKFVEHCSHLMTDSCFFVLEADAATLAARRAGRGDTKPDTFLSGRRTKYRNILARFPVVKPLRNGDPTEGDEAFAVIRDALLPPQKGTVDGNRLRACEAGA